MDTKLSSLVGSMSDRGGVLWDQVWIKEQPRRLSWGEPADKLVLSLCSCRVLLAQTEKTECERNKDGEAVFTDIPDGKCLESRCCPSRCQLSMSTTAGC